MKNFLFIVSILFLSIIFIRCGIDGENRRYCLHIENKTDDTIKVRYGFESIFIFDDVLPPREIELNSGAERAIEWYGDSPGGEKIEFEYKGIVIEETAFPSETRCDYYPIEITDFNK